MRISDWSSDVCSSDLSDSVLDALLAQDPESRVACETATTTGTVWVFGEVTTQAYVEIEDIVRKTVREIGYTDSAHGFDAETCAVISSIKGQARKSDVLGKCVYVRVDHGVRRIMKKKKKAHRSTKTRR